MFTIIGALTIFIFVVIPLISILSSLVSFGTQVIVHQVEAAHDRNPDRVSAYDAKMSARRAAHKARRDASVE